MVVSVLSTEISWKNAVGASAGARRAWRFSLDAQPNPLHRGIEADLAVCGEFGVIVGPSDEAPRPSLSGWQET